MHQALNSVAISMVTVILWISSM